MMPVFLTALELVFPFQKQWLLLEHHIIIKENLAKEVRIYNYDNIGRNLADNAIYLRNNNTTTGNSSFFGNAVN